MDFSNINQSFIQLVQELQGNKAVEVLAVTYPATAEKPNKADLKKLPLGLVRYFEATNGFRLHWQNRIQDRTLINGNLTLLPAAEATKNWNDAVYFDDATRAAKKPFYPIDQFADEACCGVFSTGKNNHLHYYAFSSGEEPYDLQLTIDQYITTAIAAKCYHYWPLILKQIIEKEHSPVIQKMDDDMAELFPEFSVEKWVADYKKRIARK